MKKITFLSILLCLPFVNSNAQSTCNNRDFEDTTFSNWNVYSGDNLNGLLLPLTWVPGVLSVGNNASVNNMNARHTFITQNVLDSTVIDPVTMLPDTQMTTLAPNGGLVSVRLGTTWANYQAEKLTYQFPVLPNDYTFQYQYACVMWDGGHLYNEQPYMLVNFLDPNGIPIAGICDTIYSANPNTPFISSANVSGVQYRRWTPQSADLSAYIGQNITVEFVVSGCMFSGHYAYAYIDVSCFGAAIANVWPGDCDYDLMADNYDMLSLGLTLNSTGTTRASGNNSWTAQPSVDWPQHIALGANYKHSDCNGDGIVDLNDTLAIVMNYAQTHPYRLAGPITNPIVTSALPQIYLVPVSDTVAPNSYAYVDVFAGTSVTPLNDLLGLALTVGYTSALVAPNSCSTDFSGSHLGVKNASMITLSHDNYAVGQNDIGMCRINQSEINGYGYLGRMRVTTANVSTYSTIYFDPSGLKVINGFGTSLPSETSGCTIVIDPTLPQGINSPTQEIHINLFPNPANTNLTISTSENANKIEITDVSGRVIYSATPNSQESTIDVSEFAKGIYFVNVYSVSGKSTEQLVISE